MLRCLSWLPWVKPIGLGACAIHYTPLAQHNIKHHCLCPHAAISTTSTKPSASLFALASATRTSKAGSFPTHQLLPLPFLTAPVRWNTTESPSEGAQPALDRVLHDAHSAATPQHAVDALSGLAEAAQGHGGEHGHAIGEAASKLVAQLLGESAPSSSSNSSNSSTVPDAKPIEHLDIQQLSRIVLSLSELAEAKHVPIDSSVLQLVDAIAARAGTTSVMEQPTDAALLHWAMLLRGTAKMGIKYEDSPPAVHQLFDAAAQQMPAMLQRGQHYNAESLSRALWAFARAGYQGSLQQLVAEVAGKTETAMMDAEPKNWSNILWALGKLHQCGAALGEEAAVKSVAAVGATAIVRLKGAANPQALSNTLWALATLDHHPGTVTLDTLATAMAERSYAAKPQELSNFLSALASLGHRPGTDTIDTLTAAIVERSSTAKPVDLSQALKALATLGHHPGTATVNTLANAMAERSSTVEPRAVSNMLWALAALDHHPGDAALNTLAAAMVECSGTAEPEALSYTMWSLSTLNHHPGTSIIETFTSAMVDRSSTATPQTLSIFLLALASFGHHLGTDTLSTLATALAQRSSTADPQELTISLSISLRALANLGHHPGTATIDTLGAAMAACSNEATPHNTANALWALATLGHHPGDATLNTLATAMEQRSSTAEPQELSRSLWALATLGHNPGTATLSTLASALAEHCSTAEPQELSTSISISLQALANLGHHPGASIINNLAAAMAECSNAAAPRSLSYALWALATLGHHPGNANLNTLATAMAKCSSTAEPQELSKSLWALASLGHHPGNVTITTLANAMAEHSSTAAPNHLSNVLWALATLDHHPGKATIKTLASAMAEGSSIAVPQNLSNTLWALATLDHNPGNETINTLAAAAARCSGTAKPQELSNTLWALGTLGHYPGNETINTLAAASARCSGTAIPQNLSNALQGLGSLRWYRPEVYSKLVECLLHSISSSDATEQLFSNAMFSCALSCHFDSSVDALAAWGSQQDLQQWTVQAISNTLYAWAILTATAGGDTANMHALAQHLFQEASRRGAARFTIENDLGKLYSAHREAQYRDLPGGGLTDSKLLQVCGEERKRVRQHISKLQSQNRNAIATALQGHYALQAAMVQGYHTLLVPHNGCPTGIAIVVTQLQRDYLRHPAGQLYGKTALLLKHIEQGCDGLVLCGDSELRGSSIDQRREVLVHRIEQAAGSQKQGVNAVEAANVTPQMRGPPFQAVSNRPEETLDITLEQLSKPRTAEREWQESACTELDAAGNCRETHAAEVQQRNLACRVQVPTHAPDLELCNDSSIALLEDLNATVTAKVEAAAAKAELIKAAQGVMGWEGAKAPKKLDFLRYCEANGIGHRKADAITSLCQAILAAAGVEAPDQQQQRQQQQQQQQGHQQRQEQRVRNTYDQNCSTAKAH